MSLASACVVVVLTVTAYVPGAGGINGGTKGGYDRIDGKWVGGKTLTDTDAACGFGYHFGTRFTVLNGTETLGRNGMPAERVCNDRGGAIKNGNLDLAVTGPDAMKRARDWGKRRVPVEICTPPLTVPVGSP